MTTPGTLYLVSTPIGNLGDISRRAAEILEASDLCLAEDTRKTGTLLKSLGVRPPLWSFHDHNEERKLPDVLKRLEEGSVVSLVSDAGTPLLSDPGYTLVRACRERGIQVFALPGPSAILTALVLSGFPPYPFTFTGYPPRKSGRRGVFWDHWLRSPHTIVFFSTPHAILKHLEEIDTRHPDRPLFLAREMTKLHEEHLRGTAGEILAILRERPRVKGELTLVLAPLEGGS